MTAICNSRKVKKIQKLHICPLSHFVVSKKGFTFALRFRYGTLTLTNNKKYIIMSKKCEITGKKVIVGNNVSHSRIHTKRTFAPNLQTTKFYSPEEDMWITLKVSAKGMRIINKKGIIAALNDAASQGHLMF